MRLEQMPLPVLLISSAILVIVQDLSLKSQYHGTGRVRDFLGSIVGRIAEGHACLRQGGDIDQVIAHPIPDNDLAGLTQKPGGRRVDLEAPYQQRIDLPPLLASRVARPPIGKKDKFGLGKGLLFEIRRRDKVIADADQPAPLRCSL